jgi:cytochrome b6
MIDQEMTESIAIKSHVKALEFQYFIQRSATFLVIATFSLVLLASPTGIALSSDFITNEALYGQLHKFAGHGLIVVAILQVVILFLGRKFHIANPSK